MMLKKGKLTLLIILFIIFLFVFVKSLSSFRQPLIIMNVQFTKDLFFLVITISSIICTTLVLFIVKQLPWINLESRKHVFYVASVLFVASFLLDGISYNTIYLILLAIEFVIYTSIIQLSARKYKDSVFFTVFSLLTVLHYVTRELALMTTYSWLIKAFTNNFPKIVLCILVSYLFYKLVRPLHPSNY